jgi:hypothetical protein
MEVTEMEVRKAHLVLIICLSQWCQTPVSRQEAGRVMQAVTTKVGVTPNQLTSENKKLPLSQTRALPVSGAALSTAKCKTCHLHRLSPAPREHPPTCAGASLQHELIICSRSLPLETARSQSLRCSRLAHLPLSDLTTTSQA